MKIRHIPEFQKPKFYIRFIMKRALLIVDQEYIRGFAESNPSNRIDLLKLPFQLETQLPNIKIYEKYFVGSVMNPTNAKKAMFFQWLCSAPPNGPGYRLELSEFKKKNCFCTNCNYHQNIPIQKGVDIFISSISLKHCFQNRCDVVFILASDEEYQEFVKVCHSEIGKEVFFLQATDTWTKNQLMPEIVYKVCANACFICGTERSNNLCTMCQN